MPKPARELTDLHIHVGGAVAPHVLWSIAHQQGFKLPVKDYWEFVDLVSASSNKVQSLQDYLHILHTVTEKIQSAFFDIVNGRNRKYHHWLSPVATEHAATVRA